jgi:hypothetical protein
MANFQVIVHGAHELEAAFENVKVEVDPAVGKVLSEAGKTIATDASINAIANIRNIGSVWSEMKSGRRRTMVYVAEKHHRAGGSPRPNLSPLLFNKALLPAARANDEATVAAVEVALDLLCGRVNSL